MPLVVKDGKVVDTGAVIGSEQWREFLEGSASFRYETEKDGGYTATKQGDYWYASRKSQGKLYRKYVGTTSELNSERLDAAAIALSEMISQSVKENPVTPSRKGDEQLQRQVEYLTQKVEQMEAQIKVLTEQIRLGEQAA